uniref:RRM domain-containing protein n=4 Tax=Aegilops tauschii subsp. strangulata TaxID=200361 RepID=A0A453L772_AEGTS
PELPNGWAPHRLRSHPSDAAVAPPPSSNRWPATFPASPSLFVRFPARRAPLPAVKPEAHGPPCRHRAPRRMGPPPGDVVVISSDEDEGSPRRSVSPGSLGWVALRGDSPPPVPVPRRKKGKSRGVRARKDNDDNDDDCVILDGDPDGPAVVACAKGRGAGDGASDEVEIVAVKGKIACKDFPHPRHLCSELPFSTTPHPKHCKMCYCYVCDAPAPCKQWGKGLLNGGHCHATDKDTKWVTLRQSFKRNFEPGEEATVSAGNLPYGFDTERLRQFFRSFTTREQARVVDRGTGFDIERLGQLFRSFTTREQARAVDRETG